MVHGVVVATSYRKNCIRTRTVDIDKPMKRTGHSQIHLLEKYSSEPEQLSSLLKLLLTISISKREGHDKLTRCGKMSTNWPNVQVFWRCGRLMQNRKSTLRGLVSKNITIRVEIFQKCRSFLQNFWNTLNRSGWPYMKHGFWKMRFSVKRWVWCYCCSYWCYWCYCGSYWVWCYCGSHWVSCYCGSYWAIYVSGWWGIEARNKFMY